MTEIAVLACIAPNCKLPAVPGSPLCGSHKEALQKVEDQILTDATRWVKLEMRQFERLLLAEPPLHSAELAHRMGWKMKKVRQMLRKFKDERA